MPDTGDETADAPYLVPEHVAEAQSIGPIPVRTFFVVLGVGLVVGVPLATLARLHLGDVGLWFALVPIVLSLPYALPFFRPPPEYGTLRLLAHLAARLFRRTTLGVPQQPELALHFYNDVVYVPSGRRTEPRAVYRVPTINLDTASAGSRRTARARWGAVLNGLRHPIQIVIRGTPATTLPVIERVKAHGSVQARALAAWLGAHLIGSQLVQRARYLVIPGESIEVLHDRCVDLERSLRRIGLPPERLSGEELRATISAFLSPRPMQVGPAVIQVSSDYVVADGEHASAFDVGKLPPTIITDWAAPLLEGDLPLDCSIDIEPQDVAWAKLRLDTRRNQLESSAMTPGRAVALEQISGLRMAYERRKTLPMKLTMTLVVRGVDRAMLRERAKRLQQRADGLGAELRSLRWEQRGGWLAVVPLRRLPMSQRGQDVETGTVARTYPFSDGTLTLEGGVPFGVAASAPVTFTVAQAKRAGRKGWRHMCWHGSTGSGKGYQLRVYLSREHFANGLRIYVIDQDEQQEYAGRFCDYLNGSRVPIRTLLDAELFTFTGVPNPDVVVWDLHESEETSRGAIFAELKRKLCDYQLSGRKRRMALVVDEAVTVTEDDQGRKALGDLARRGRHFGVELHVLTQRVSDWFDTQIGRTIQGTAANQWYGQMEDREVREIVEHGTDLSIEEQELIRRAGQGEGLLVTAGQRVWVSLYGHTSPDEFRAFNTDKEEVEYDDGTDDESAYGSLAYREAVAAAAAAD